MEGHLKGTLQHGGFSSGGTGLMHTPTHEATYLREAMGVSASVRRDTGAYTSR